MTRRNAISSLCAFFAGLAAPSLAAIPEAAPWLADEVSEFCGQRVLICGKAYNAFTGVLTIRVEAVL